MSERFALFGGDDFYPSGGWDDYLGTFRSIEDAKTYLYVTGSEDWAEIVDLDTGQILERWNRRKREWKPA